MKNILKAVAPFCAASFVASSFAQSSDETTIVGYGPELVVNGDFETPPTRLKGNSTADKFTLDITGSENWYASITKDDDGYKLPGGEACSGVGCTGAKNIGYYTSSWVGIDSLKTTSGSWMAFMMNRGTATITDNVIWCGVNVPAKGTYRYSFLSRNAKPSQGYGAKVIAELRNDYSEISKNDGTKAYDLGYIQLPGVNDGAWVSVTGSVDINEAGDYQFYFRQEKDPHNKVYYSYICIDAASLRPAYTSVESLFAAATADGGDVVLAKDLYLSAEDNATVPAGTSLTIDAEGHALGGTIYVNGELTLENGDFSACSFVIGENGKVNAPTLAECNIIVNGDFETPPTSVREEDVYVYTLDITRSANWYASLIKEDNFALVNGTSCSGVGYEGADDMGGYTADGTYHTWLGALNPISGSWMAFMMDRKSDDITENVIWCGVNVPANGIYRFSFSAMNGSKSSGYGAKLIAELRNGYSEISKNDGEKAYDLGYIQLSGTKGNQDKESVSGYVNIDQAGEFQFYFRQEKDPYDEHYYSYVCIDKVGLFRLYSTTEDIFKSATADGATFTLVGNATAPAAGVTLEAGKKLVLDAGGKALSGVINVDGELTVKNGDFDDCVFNVSSSGKLVFDGISESGATIAIKGGKVVCTAEPTGIKLPNGYYFEQSSSDSLWHAKKDGFTIIIR